MVEGRGPVGQASSVVADHVMASVHEAYVRKPFEDRNGALESTGLKYVVCVEPRHVATTGELQTAVPVARDADVREPAIHPEPCVLEARERGDRAIEGGIIEDDYLELQTRLRKRTLDRCTNVPLRLKRGDAHADDGVAHHAVTASGTCDASRTTGASSYMVQGSPLRTNRYSRSRCAASPA